MTWLKISLNLSSRLTWFSWIFYIYENYMLTVTLLSTPVLITHGSNSMHLKLENVVRMTCWSWSWTSEEWEDRQSVTCYKRAMQKSICQCKTHRTMKQKSYSSRRACSSLLAKNRKMRLQFTPRLNKTGKTLSRLDFYFNIRLVGSELGLNIKKIRSCTRGSGCLGVV